MDIVNTRPTDVATELTEQLKSSGVRVFEMPLLSINPLRLDVAGQERLQHIARYDLVVCVSPRAAHFAWEAAQKAGVDICAQKNWVSVGQTTATALAGYGIESVAPIEQSNEGMLNLSMVKSLQANQRILMVRGMGGRRLLQDVLQNKGVKVDELALYTRSCPEDLSKSYKSLVSWQVDKRPFVLVSSKQAFQNWLFVCNAPQKFNYIALGARLFWHIKKQLNLSAIRTDSLAASYILQACNTF